MTQRIKFNYSCSEAPTRTFQIMIDPTITCQEVLKIISEKQKKSYTSLYYKGILIKNCNHIKDFLERDPNSIFSASTNNNHPTSKYKEKHQKSNTKPNPQARILPKVKPIVIQQQPPKILQPKTSSKSTQTKNFLKQDQPKSHSNLNQPKIINIRSSCEIRSKNDEYYTFYFTGGRKEDLMKGIQIELNSSLNPFQCCNKLHQELSQLNEEYNQKRIIVYLACGIPFIGGTLGDFYSNKEKKFKREIYGILTNEISDSILNKHYYELCNVSDLEHKSLLSPLCNSSEKGLCEIACLLGFLNHDGDESNVLIRAFAFMINFPPLITSLNKIIEYKQIEGRDIVTVCSTLFTYFRHSLPSTIPDNSVFENTLDLCNSLSNVEGIPDSIKVTEIEVDSELKFLSKMRVGPIVYLWDNFNESKSIEEVESIKGFNKQNYLKPIDPLMINSFPYCRIVKGKQHEYLYLMKSQLKDIKSQNMIDIIDPLTGMIETKDIEIFAKEQSDENDYMNYIQQIIMFNLDESKSMIYDSDDNFITPKSDEVHRITIAHQYITTFLSKIQGYKIPCIQGLVSFNNTIKIRCPLSPFISDIESKGLINIKPESTPKLYDSLYFSCQEIIKFKEKYNLNKEEKSYKRLYSRIVVITSSEDEGSKTKVSDIVKLLIQNKIIVDCIIINKNDEFQMLAAICHATGGSILRPKSIKEGISLIEQESFINYEVRKLSSIPLIPNERSTIFRRLKPEKITEEFMNKVKNHSYINTDTVNILLIRFNLNVITMTPRRCLYFSMNQEQPNLRRKRILREIHALVGNKQQELNDPDVKIFLHKAFLDHWIVYIKGPEYTPYENKWWYLYITFPDEYPYRPPNIRFASIPYHINVSSDGIICLDSITKRYIPSKHVIDIIQEIKEIFLLPCIDSPVNIESYFLFMNDRERYEMMARISAQDNAKDDFTEYKLPYIDDEVPSDFSIQPFNHAPPFKISQISGKEIKKDNLFKASSGVFYDKNELKRLVTSSKNPICVITGKSLSEYFSDSDDND